ncbi:MAG: hypothetical protein ACRD4B_06820, partial [Acidobacteriota bacterium]
YIESQHEHHKTTTFQDEYWRSLRKHNVAFDPSVIPYKSKTNKPFYMVFLFVGKRSRYRDIFYEFF